MGGVEDRRADRGCSTCKKHCGSKRDRQLGEFQHVHVCLAAGLDEIGVRAGRASAALAMGRASRANITAGNFVTEQSVLTSIAGVARVYAYFEGSEQTFLHLRVLTVGEAAPRVQMGLANETAYPPTGELDVVDNRLNPQTGAIRLQASFDNTKGQFTYKAGTLLGPPCAREHATADLAELMWRLP